MSEGGSGRQVAVTGAAGSLGRCLVARLCERPEVARVVALDRAPVPTRHPKLEAVACDVRDPDLARHLAGCDTVVHLAFIVERGSRDPAETEAINVGGTRNVCRAAVAAGAGQIVYASSVACYGFHEDTDGVLLDEQAERRGNDHFYYGRHKAAVEHWLDGFEAEHPGLRIARLRPGVFLSERSPRAVPGLRVPVHFVLPGRQPKLQILHEDDVAEAFVLAVLARAHGAYNVVNDEPLSSAEIARALGKRTLPLPRAVLSLYRLLWRLRLTDIDPIWLELVNGPSLLASGDKLRRELSWRPRYRTTADVLRQLSGRGAPELGSGAA